MTERATEARHSGALGLDALPLGDAAQILARAQAEAAAVVAGASPAIAAAAGAMAQVIRTGHVLHYAAAGSSGLMAAADVQEMGGTFSIPAAQLRIHMAGGLPRGVEMPGDTEDQTTGLRAALAELQRDDLLVALSASGETPYTLAAVDLAQKAGARVVAIANNPGASLLARADFPIALATPPEVLAGSTRMGAGTAQKIALNMLSTLMALQLGHVHDGLMVNLRADNAKLRARARGIVTTIAGVGEAAASSALEASQGDVKTAVLLAAGAETPAEARALLQTSGGHLRPALNETKKIQYGG